MKEFEPHPIYRAANSIRAAGEPSTVVALYGCTLFFGQCFMVGVLGSTALSLYRQSDLNEHGMRSQGTIFGKEIKHAKYDDTWYINFRYTIAGRKFESSSSVTAAQYKAARPGELIPITYLASSPGISRADASLDRTDAPGNFQAACFAFIGTTALIAAMAASLRKWYRAKTGAEPSRA